MSKLCDNCINARAEAMVAAGRSNRTKAAPGKEHTPGNGASKKETQVLTFSCLICNTGLRFRLPLSEAGTYRCPACKSEYKAVKATGSPVVFVMLPGHQREQAHPSQRPRRKATPQVLAAFAVFSLDEGASFEQVRQAYHESVKAYHPDRVADLGSDLRRLAESKTKELNAAYQILEKFYAI